MPESYVNVNTLPDTVEANPPVVWIEPTNRCNTRCRHCEHFNQTFGEDMDRATFRKIFDAIGDDIQGVTLIGYGEPLAARNFEEFFEECLARNAQVSFTTNGILLHDMALLRRLIRLPVHIEISIDGASKATYEFVRPYIKWEKMRATLEMIREVTREAGDEKKWKLSLNFVVMKHSFRELPEIVKLAAHSCIDEVRVLPLIANQELADQVVDENDPEFSKYLSIAYREAQKNNIDFPLMGFFKKIVKNNMSFAEKGTVGISLLRSRGIGGLLRTAIKDIRFTKRTGLRPCIVPWSRSYFAQDGKVLPCCMYGHEMGDMNAQTFPEIWNGQKYKSLRRTIHSWNPTRICRYCGFPSGVNGGDSTQYTKFLKRYSEEHISLKEEFFGDGFYEMEYQPSGEPSHIWMRKNGKITLPNRKNARFLKLHIIPQTEPLFGFNCGHAQINNLPAESFDNTCDSIMFPLPKKYADNEELSIRLEMENDFNPPGDARRLSLAIAGISYLSPNAR